LEAISNVRMGRPPKKPEPQKGEQE